MKLRKLVERVVLCFALEQEEGDRAKMMLRQTRKRFDQVEHEKDARLRWLEGLRVLLSRQLQLEQLRELPFSPSSNPCLPWEVSPWA